MRLARGGAREGTMVVAGAQSQGRGRLGRSWFSPPGGGFYVSVVLRPAAPPDRWASVSVLAGVGLVDGLAAAGVPDVRLKWPNDCLVGGRKLAGILAEACPEEGFLVLGIGLNVCWKGSKVPPDLASMSTDLGSELPQGSDLERVCAQGLTGAVTAYVESRPSLDVDSTVANRFLWTGGNVTVGSGSGRVVGIDRTGALILETREGTRDLISVGEVTDAGSD